MTRVSVTEVRNALRCPRLFALGRQGTSVRFPVGGSTLGATFHRLAERFAGGVETPPPWFARLGDDAQPHAVEAALARWLLELLVDELRAKPALASMPAEVDDLAESLRQLAAHLAARLAAVSGPVATRLRTLVHAAEREIEAPIPGLELVISGRIDALYLSPGSQPIVVEYKLTDEQGTDLDRWQVALYQMLVRLTTGAEAHGVVLRFTPACVETRVEPHEARAIEHRELAPLLARLPEWVRSPELAPATNRPDLCAHCPVASACARTYGDLLPARDEAPTSAARLRLDLQSEPEPAAARVCTLPSMHDADGHREADELAERIQRELRRLGVATEVSERQVGAQRIVLALRVMRGSLRKLDAAASEVQVALGRPGVTYERPSHARAFVVPRERPRPVSLGRLLAEDAAWLAERPGRAVLGEQLSGAPLRVDLADSATPHLLVGGQAGSGKSVLLQVLATSLVHQHPPSAVRLTLVDPKRVTFSGTFRSAMAAHLDGPVLFDADDIWPALENLVEEMERRYELLESAQVQDLHEYNDKVPESARLPRRVLLLDEFADLSAGTSAQQFLGLLDRLGAKARAAGIHLVLATQRPDKQSVPSRLKANLGGKIALRVASRVNSRIVLDAGGAEDLLGKGDLLADLGRGLVRAQGAMLATGW
jgi:S-DNA-T family DNA segregation ATPase FtsK/SpoIIIE